MGQTLGEEGELVAVVVEVLVEVLMVEGRAKDEDERRGILALHCTLVLHCTYSTPGGMYVYGGTQGRLDARHKSITYKYWMCCGTSSSRLAGCLDGVHPRRLFGSVGVGMM